VRHARADEVGGKQKWNRQTEPKLKRFPKRHAQMLPAVKRVKSEGQMNDQRAIKRYGRQWIAPETHEPRAPGFHGIERDQPQGVIGEVGCQIGQQHET
jgi:hypothetical protein